jgi:hypothetical protein
MKICENPDCNCETEASFVQDGRYFCGTSCVREDGEGIVCACGHAGCPAPDDLAVSAPKAAGA